MKYNLKSEIPVLIVVMLPFLYLGIIWNALPDTIPTHWDLYGKIDGYNKKATLLWIPFLLPLLTYLIFLIAPVIDPKKRLQNMGDKLTKLKFAITFIMSLLALFIIHASKEQKLSPNLIPILIGTLFAVSGNFFPTLKPNYFIGIRIPWTLNNENNWKLTHRFAGKLWLIGGISIIIYSLIAQPETSHIFLLCTTTLITVAPIIYSFRIYKSKENTTPEKNTH